MLLVSLRAQVDALIAMEEADAGIQAPQDGCPHPEEKRVNTTTMGGGPAKFYCTECRETVEGQA